MEESLLARGNKAFREGNYHEALRCYEQLLLTAPAPLLPSIEFNRSLVKRRLRALPAKQGQTEGETETPMPAALERPEDLDPYFFDLIRDSGLFDPAWYLAQYGEKYNITGNPLAHYLAHGVALSTNPSPGFYTAYYLKTNPDVAASGFHPFLHYVC